MCIVLELVRPTLLSLWSMQEWGQHSSSGDCGADSRSCGVGIVCDRVSSGTVDVSSGSGRALWTGAVAVVRGLKRLLWAPETTAPLCGRRSSAALRVA